MRGVEIYRDQFTPHVPLVLLINPIDDIRIGYENYFSDMSESLRSRRISDCVYEVDVFIARMRSIN